MCSHTASRVLPIENLKCYSMKTVQQKFVFLSQFGSVVPQHTCHTTLLCFGTICRSLMAQGSWMFAFIESS